MNQITRLRKDRAAEPVLAESLKDQAYEAIKHRIITCAFKPGQELSESAVAGLLKIGRTPVHQAFDRLNTEGLVDVQPRKGVVVRPINLDEVIEIIEIRLLNETFAVRLAAERASSAEIMAIRDVLAKAGSAVAAGKVETMMLLDREFHRLIARRAQHGACGNSVEASRALVAAVVHFAGRAGSSGQRQRSAPQDFPGDLPPRRRGCRERDARPYRFVSAQRPA